MLPSSHVHVLINFEFGDTTIELMIILFFFGGGYTEKAIVKPSNPRRCLSKSLFDIFFPLQISLQLTNFPRYSVIVLGPTIGYDDVDGEHPKPTQYSAVSRRLASRSNYDDDDATTMAYYDARKSLEQDRKKETFLFSKKKGRMFSRRRETSNISTVEMPM
ncbi:unnamed protein product [Brassica rapa]|uniref:Uncharacterized protein n=1 Tax=Brassica campestris TaxID=3711 RepID=A0A8D9GNL2_BRACM|nr:unnamed protein product [Brassica rapa]